MKSQLLHNYEMCLQVIDVWCKSHDMTQQISLSYPENDMFNVWSKDGFIVELSVKKTNTKYGLYWPYLVIKTPPIPSEIILTELFLPSQDFVLESLLTELIPNE